MPERPNHIGTAYLTTERLVLRRFRGSDATDMYERWASDPEVTRFLTWEPHASLRESERIINGWVADYENPSTYVWAIALKEDSDRPIGGIAAHPDLANDSVAIGYSLGRDWWGRGIITEAASRLVEYFFDDIHVNRIEITCDPDNGGSRRVAEKLGFRSEGVLRQGIRLPERYGDLVVYSLLASERDPAQVSPPDHD